MHCGLRWGTKTTQFGGGLKLEKKKVSVLGTKKSQRETQRVFQLWKLDPTGTKGAFWNGLAQYRKTKSDGTQTKKKREEEKIGR